MPHFVKAHAYGNDFICVRAGAPGGSQRVEWPGDGVYLTGWVELLCEGGYPARPAAG
jgi:diaminopimelate epimerase